MVNLFSFISVMITAVQACNIKHDVFVNLYAPQGWHIQTWQLFDFSLNKYIETKQIWPKP